jgi:hypothetical protein
MFKIKAKNKCLKNTIVHIVNMEKQIEELTKRLKLAEERIHALEQGASKPAKREKRPPTDKQKEQHARFKKAYDKWAPHFKKENPSLKSHEIFKMVHAKIKEEYSF